MTTAWVRPISLAGDRRVALVTGASRRIGLRIVQRLVTADYAVIMHTSEASCDETMRAADKFAADATVGVVVADLAAATVCDALMPAVVAATGRVDLLVNNASVFVDDDAFEHDAASWDRHFAVNLRAPMILSAGFAKAPPVTADADRVIVNMLDQRVLRLTPQFLSYTLSKSALWTATRTLAQAYAARKIRVNAVGPGPVLPNTSQGDAGFAREVAGVPLACAVTPDDLADAVLYLATARMVTGQMIAVDAGQHLGWQTPDIVT